MSNLIFEKIQQTLAALGLLKIGIAGNFIRIAEAQWPVTLRLLRGGQVIGSASNMLAGDYIRDVDFDGFEIVNGATAQSVTVQISGGGAGSDRVLGEVSVIDGGKFRSMSGAAFCGYGYTAGVAGQYAHSQLWNPAASGKNLVLEQVGSFSIAAMTQGVGARVATVALTTLVGAAPAKKMGMSGSSAEIRTQNNAAILGGASNMFVLSSAAPVYKPAEPVVIPPGYGLNMFNGLLAQDFGAAFEFFEEPI